MSRYRLHTIFVLIAVSSCGLALVAKMRERLRIVRELQAKSFVVVFNDQFVRASDGSFTWKQPEPPPSILDAYWNIAVLMEIPTDADAESLHGRRMALRRAIVSNTILSLHLVECPIGKEDAEFISHEPLKALRMGDNADCDSIKTLVSALHNLEYLDLSHSLLRDQDGADLAELEKLITVDLSRTRIGPVTCQSLSKLRNLANAHLVNCECLDSESIGWLGRSNSIRSLDLSSNNLSNDDLVRLNNPNLQILFLYDTPNLTTSEIEKYAAMHPHVHVVFSDRQSGWPD